MNALNGIANGLFDLLCKPAAGLGWLTVLIVLSLILPLLFFHHSRSLWLCIDHILTPREKQNKQEDLGSE